MSIDTRKTTAGQGPVYEIQGEDGANDRTITRTDQQGRQEIAVYHADTRTIEFLSQGATSYRIPVMRALGEAGMKYSHFAIRGEGIDVVPKNSPKRPKPNPRQGDKTPELVEWYQQYRPKEFKVRYGVLGYASQTIPRFSPSGNKVFDPITGRQLFEVKTHVLVALRKTHLTELPNGTEKWEGPAPTLPGEEVDDE